MTKTQRFKDGKSFEEAVVASVHSRILKKTRQGKIFRLALSGGSTPGPIYKSLAAKEDIDWSLVEIYIVDERYVPLSDEKSNYQFLQKTLLKHLKSQIKKFKFFNTNRKIEDSLNAYEKDLDEVKSFFDLVLLGIGEDGHTASLFPNSDALSIKNRWVAHTTTKKFDVEDRLTLTFPALESSAEIFFLLKGKKKGRVLKKILAAAKTSKKYPAARLIKLKKTSVFYSEN